MVKLDRLQELRCKIDEVDQEIIELLDLRMKLAKEIGAIKKRCGMKIKDREREKEVLERARKYKRIFEEIIKFSIKVQEEDEDV